MRFPFKPEITPTEDNMLGRVITCIITIDYVFAVGHQVVLLLSSTYRQASFTPDPGIIDDLLVVALVEHARQNHRANPVKLK